MRWRIPLLAAAAALLLAAPAQARPEWEDYTRAPENGVTEEEASITMRDGVVLDAIVQRPNVPGRFPVIVVQTPYNKEGVVNTALGGTALFFVQRGYVVMTVDVRGTGTSGGRWDSFGKKEQRDGKEVIEWAAEQSWSDGKVGTFGPSYMAITQIYTAAQRPKGLKAIFPIVPLADGYRDIVFSGGQVNVSFIPFWLGLVTLSSMTPQAPPSNPLDLGGWLLNSLSDLADRIDTVVNFEAPAVAGAVTGDDIAFDGPFWKKRSPLEVVKRIRVPAFFTGGLHDLFQRGTPLLYERLKHKANVRLLMGPWTHVGGASGAGLPRDGVPALNTIALRWFDRFLKGINTRIGKIPQVTQYDWGAGRYKTQGDWPNPRMRVQRHFLKDGGVIERGKPRVAGEPQSFQQNPLTGICTQSTGQWTAGLGDQMPCTTEDRVNEAQGAAIYETSPLQKPMKLDGPILARLWVTTTANDAVVAARLFDVAPDGSSQELTAGWLAASLRAVDRSRSRFDSRRKYSGRLLQPWHPFTRASLKDVTPGEPVRLQTEIFPTRTNIRPGHKLKLVVQGGDFPHQVPPVQQFSGSLAGTVEVLTDPEYRSTLDLPFLRGKPRTQPTPNLTRGPR